LELFQLLLGQSKEIVEEISNLSEKSPEISEEISRIVPECMKKSQKELPEKLKKPLREISEPVLEFPTSRKSLPSRIPKKHQALA
jgi:hypothetical protein